MQTVKRILGTIALAILAAVVGGCDGFGAFGSLGPGDSCGSDCEQWAFVSPWSANILRGDSIRFAACNNYATCLVGTDTGNVVAHWQTNSPGVAALVNSTGSTIIPAATSVWVRGVARGHGKIAVTLPKNARTFPLITVADTADITSVELPAWFFFDTLRVGQLQTFQVHLRDVGGTIYRAEPTSLFVSDTTVLKLTRLGWHEGVLTVRVDGLKVGKASLQATFLSLTAKRQITVVP